MDYLIVINAIFTFLLCLAKANEGYDSCKDNEDCVDLSEEKNDPRAEQAQYIINTTGDPFGNGQLRYCELNKVCCEKEPIVNQSISEKICMLWQYTSDDFCQKIALIAHGEIPQANSLPFMALIKITYGNTSETCSGSLISRKWVLTAAHCFDKASDNQPFKTTVYLGAHNFSGSGIPFMGKVVKHPGYGGNDTLADLALIELESEAELTDKVKPACLVQNSSTRTTEYFAAGWGLNVDKPTDVLQKTNLFSTSFQICTDHISDSNEKNPTKQLCLMPQGPHGDVCPGDSGGPIFAPYPGHGNCYIEVLGVVSLGEECQKNTTTYTLHTRVDFYKDWIERIVWAKEKNAEKK